MPAGRFVGFRPWVVAASLLSAIAGCSDGAEADVSGVVSLDGTPLGPGAIYFVSVGGPNNAAIGSIQPDGSYFLSTGRTRGLSPGKYRVGVYIHEMPPGAKPTDRQQTTPSRIPLRYESTDTSGLEFDVSGGRNTINIELESPS